MMECMEYLIVLLATWFVNGSTKFAVNFLFHRKEAFSLVGYGGFPSTHTAVVTSMLRYVGAAHGFDHPVVGGLLVLLWVVVNDAKSLRMRIGEHAKHLNEIDSKKSHRERIGHKMHEIIGGAVVGGVVGLVLACLLEDF